MDRSWLNHACIQGVAVQYYFERTFSDQLAPGAVGVFLVHAALASLGISSDPSSMPFESLGQNLTQAQECFEIFLDYMKNVPLQSKVGVLLNLIDDGNGDARSRILEIIRENVQS